MSTDFEVRKQTLINLGGNPQGLHTIYEVDLAIEEALRNGAGGGNSDGGSSTPMVNVTYSELKSMRDSGTLTAGMQYRITDYVATTIEEGSMSADHPFDIIVTANSASVLDENARAIQHEGDTYFSSCNMQAWKLNYCIDNDTNRWGWADSTNGKGVIYRMIDEFGNDVGYDFKGIVFKRHKITGFNEDGAGLEQYSKIKGCIGKYAHESCSSVAYFTFDEADYKWFYLFSLLKNDVVTDYSVNFLPANWQGIIEYPINNKYENDKQLLNGVHIIYNSGRPAQFTHAGMYSVRWTCEANCGYWDCKTNSYSWYSTVGSQGWQTGAGNYGFINSSSNWESSTGWNNVYVGDIVDLDTTNNAWLWIIANSTSRNCKIDYNVNPSSWNTKRMTIELNGSNTVVAKNAAGEIFQYNPTELASAFIKSTEATE